ncbi:Vacuolar amino acid transporter 2 [Golovinomyces cichoracearum]|uniref:Vacuolar amino acid transporter 2 n=1 Tax=Golovinomyces cichoracearum TaxID=62708 RepID=A0A420J4H0_9PEZI|nr:Vacuolar amino acid transporter 2 [Golovinomyces cichoracearum]
MVRAKTKISQSNGEDHRLLSSSVDNDFSNGSSEDDDEYSLAQPYHEAEPLISTLNKKSQSSESGPDFDYPPSPQNSNGAHLDPLIDETTAARASPPPPYDDELPQDNNSRVYNARFHIDYNEQDPLTSDQHTSWSEEDILTRAEREHLRPKSGIRSAFMNMANSIIGAGIIGQPYAFRQAGILAGITLLILLTIMVDWTIRLIVINSKLSGSNSFQGTMEHCFGHIGLITISIAQWAFAFGGMIAFGIIVGDTIPHVVIALWPQIVNIPILSLLSNRQVVIAVLIMCVSYPLCLYRDISKLAKASTMAMLSMIIIIFTVITQGALIAPESKDTPGSSLLKVKGEFFQAISVISFALVCHHNSFLIYDSLKTPTINRFSRVTHYSTIVSMIACLAVALSGFLTFGSSTQGNVLNNFPTNNTLVNVARLCFGLNMLTTLPLEAFVCREVVVNYWFGGKPFNLFVHILLTTGHVLCAMIISLFVCDLGVVLEIIGAISACTLGYIIPPLCYIKLSTRSWRTIPATACIFFGFVTMIISLVQTFSKMIRHEGETATCQ